MTTITEKPAAAPLSAEKRKALGRGLDSLLPSAPRVANPAPNPPTAEAPPRATFFNPPLTRVEPIIPESPDGTPLPVDAHAVLHLPLDWIERNPYQTRSSIEDTELEELAASIRTNGVLQPITVRQVGEQRYALITGERRWRATQRAGRNTIPSIVRHVSDQQALEMTIVENLQREDLNCIDQARAFARLSQEFGLTQEKIALRTGCERSTVGNYLRLLKLPGEVQDMLKAGQLEFSHARVLLQLRDPNQIPKVAERAVAKKMSVQLLEDLVMELSGLKEAPPEAAKPRVDPNVHAAEQELQRLLGCRVSVRDRRGRGKIVIEYKTIEDFDRVMEMLKGKNQ
jgi:ParB family transcriptional regulator, chromosome partitioning protein